MRARRVTQGRRRTRVGVLAGVVACSAVLVTGCGQPSAAAKAQKVHATASAFITLVQAPIATLRSVDSGLAGVIASAQVAPTSEVGTLIATTDAQLAAVETAFKAEVPPALLAPVFTALESQIPQLVSAISQVASFVEGTVSLSAGEASVARLMRFPASLTSSIAALYGNAQVPTPSGLLPLPTNLDVTTAASPSPNSQAPSASDDQTTSTAPAPTATKVNLATAQLSLNEYVPRFGSTQVVSSIAAGPEGLLAAVSSAPTQYAPGQIAILTYDGSTWTTAQVLGSGDDLGDAIGVSSTPVTAVHLTTSLFPDFYAQLAEGDHDSAVVASYLDNAWELVPFNDNGTSSVQAIDPVLTLSTRTIAQSLDNCVPNCAEGTNYSTTFAFSPAGSDFIPSS
jgi:hypothetical protein